MAVVNEYGQPVGDPLPNWIPSGQPDTPILRGRYCTLEPLDPGRHASQLADAYSAAPDTRDWTYLPYGPFLTVNAYRDWTIQVAQVDDPRFYAVVDNDSNSALGTLALMRQDPQNGTIEVGHVAFSRALQRTPISTEAQYLLMRYIFDALRYRRYEWKCDSLNAPSREAAERLGFTYEGTFRQAAVYKGRTRDTAWYSVVDREWPHLRTAFEHWLQPANFELDGTQIQRLRARRPSPHGPEEAPSGCASGPVKGTDSTKT